MFQYYVSTQGSDSNPGTYDLPFATIGHAQAVVRKRISAGLCEPITVVVMAGSYHIQSLTFNESDSGTPEYPITYIAEGVVSLCGGLSLRASDFTPITTEEKIRFHGDAADKVVKTDLKTLGLTRSDWGEICAIGFSSTASRYDGAVLSPMWCELFVDDKRMEIARYPDNTFLYTEDVIQNGADRDPSANGQFNTSRNPLGDIHRIDKDTAERVSKWKTLENVWVYGYPKFGWADESSPVKAIDTVEHTLETTYVSYFGTREHAPYYFFNVLEELDVPGEWYLDRDHGVLYLYPPTDLEKADICLSITTENLIKVCGASNLIFSGFTISATRSDAISIQGDRVTIDKCEIKNVAGWAVKINGNHCTVQNSVIHHTGEGGIQVNGGDRRTLTSSENVITNNHIYHIAEIFRTYRPGVAIDGVGCVVSHNSIHDSAHMAVSFSGNEHVIEYNEIFNVCKIADDSSAIYAGRDYTTCGNIIRYNYFHDMSSDAEEQNIGIFAVYCDDNLGGCAIYGNIMYRCQSALLLHGGHDMIFSNNLIIDRCAHTNYAVCFHAYEYWEDLIESPGSVHWSNLRVMPWQDEVWAKKYPHIAEYVTWDPETEQKNPHYCSIENNVIINHSTIDIKRFNCFERQYHNTFRNNIELADRKFAGIPDGEKLDLSNCRLEQILPEFHIPPLSEMGQLHHF